MQQQFAAQKQYKSKHDWVERVIHCELCKRLGFNHMERQHMQKLETVPENRKKKKLLWDYEIETGHKNANVEIRSNCRKQRKDLSVLFQKTAELG